MIQIIKKDCCGCNACVQRCPKRCITMRADNEGFLYPIVDTTICIDCGICEKVCPVINKTEPKQPLKVYAAYNKNEDVRMQSSSGGIFTLLAEKVLAEGGSYMVQDIITNWNDLNIAVLTTAASMNFVKANILNHISVTPLQMLGNNCRVDAKCSFVELLAR